MALSPDDLELVATMKQRELQLKRRQRATDAIVFKTRRYRAALVTAVTVVTAAVVTGAFLLVENTLPVHRDQWRPTVLVVAVGLALGAQLGPALLRTRRGRQLIARKESRLRDEYSGELHAGRRWLQFYYQGEDISAYVPQVLYFLEGDRRVDSVQAALDLARSNRRETDVFAEHAMSRFLSVVAEINELAVASTDAAGRPSNRLMRFVTTDRAGVWYITTAPEGPKVPELDLGRVALVTTPTASGATISSNRVRVRRAPVPFTAVAGLYRAQVPGYTDGMTEDQEEQELVYELTLESARVDTWLDHVAVVFDDAAAVPADGSSRAAGRRSR